MFSSKQTSALRNLNLMPMDRSKLTWSTVCLSSVFFDIMIFHPSISGNLKVLRTPRPPLSESESDTQMSENF